MLLLIISCICLIISLILFSTVFKNELSEKKKDILAFWSANFILIAGLFFLGFSFLQTIKN